MAKSFINNGIQWVRPPSDYVNALSLLASTQERQSLPSGFNYLQIQSTRDVYVRFGDNSVAATLPSDTTDGSASELNGDHTHISIISAYDCNVTLSYYSIK